MNIFVLFVDSLGGNVGLAITQALGLTGMFQWGMRQSTEMENQMTSVERYGTELHLVSSTLHEEVCKTVLFCLPCTKFEIRSG